MVVETMKKEHLSIYAAMQEFGINDHKIIERWERIYLEEGPEGLAIERRGRSSKGRPPKQLPKQVEEDLLAEVQRLRAENDYLKNLQALVLEDERRQRKKRWQVRSCGKDIPWRSFSQPLKLPRATFCYHLRRMNSTDKNLSKKKSRQYTMKIRGGTATAVSRQSGVTASCP